MDRSEVLLGQYLQCREDLGRFDSLLWAIPGVALILSAGAAAFVFGADATKGPAIVVAAGSFIFTVPLTTALVKIRVFQKARGREAELLLEALSVLEDFDPPVEDIPTSSEQVENLLKSEPPHTQPARRSKSRFKKQIVQPTIAGLAGFAERRLADLSAYQVLAATLVLAHVGQIALIGYAIVGNL